MAVDSFSGNAGVNNLNTEANKVSFGSGTPDGTPGATDETGTNDYQGLLADIMPQGGYFEEWRAAFVNSRIDSSSSNPCISATIHGKDVQVCFDQFESYFLMLGLILKVLVTFKSFDIFVTGGRVFGG